MNQVFHPWDRWECVPAGMYETIPPPRFTPESAKIAYFEFLKDIPRFQSSLQRVALEWPFSCEHFLSNENINRIAWLGQSSMCIDTGVPECFRSGFMLLTSDERKKANFTAYSFLKSWLRERDGSIKELAAFSLAGNEDDQSQQRLYSPRNSRRDDKIKIYIETWKRRGYENGIPEEVPSRLMSLNLAPSYKAIAFAILKNDHALKSLGFTPRPSQWYSTLKQIEIAQRPIPESRQYRMF